MWEFCTKYSRGLKTKRFKDAYMYADFFRYVLVELTCKRINEKNSKYIKYHISEEVFCSFRIIHRIWCITKSRWKYVFSSSNAFFFLIFTYWSFIKNVCRYFFFCRILDVSTIGLFSKDRWSAIIFIYFSYFSALGNIAHRNRYDLLIFESIKEKRIS